MMVSALGQCLAALLAMSTLAVASRSPSMMPRPRPMAWLLVASDSARWAEGLPLRRSESSMMSSCTNAAVWNTSIAQAMSATCERMPAPEPAPVAEAASKALSTSRARRRLPPSLEVTAWPMTSSSTDRHAGSTTSPVAAAWRRTSSAIRDSMRVRSVCVHMPQGYPHALSKYKIGGFPGLAGLRPQRPKTTVRMAPFRHSGGTRMRAGRNQSRRTESCTGHDTLTPHRARHRGARRLEAHRWRILGNPGRGCRCR